MERITVFISGILFVLFLFVFTTIEFVDSTSKITATHNFNNGKAFESRKSGSSLCNVFNAKQSNKEFSENRFDQ